jgi:hypothetical protein
MMPHSKARNAAGRLISMIASKVPGKICTRERNQVRGCRYIACRREYASDYQCGHGQEWSCKSADDPSGSNCHVDMPHFATVVMNLERLCSSFCTGLSKLR